MKISTLAGLLGLALLAAMVAPAVGAPAAEPDADPGCPKKCDDSEDGGGDDKGGDDKGSGDAGGSLIDIDLLLNIDLSGLGEILNSLLGILIKMKKMDDEGTASKCDKKEMAEELEGLIVKLNLFLNLLGINVKLNLLILLGPLLEALGQLLDALLTGLGLGDLLMAVINLVIGLLDALGLKLDALVKLQLGNLLNLDLAALLNLG